MNKTKGIILSMVVPLTLVFPGMAKAYEIEYNTTIPRNTTDYATPNYIVAHEAGNSNNVGRDSLDREVNYMANNYNSAFTNYFVGSGGRVVELMPSGKVSWGAGAYANWQSYAQVELSRTDDYEIFIKDYSSYVSLLRDLAKNANIPVKLDEAGRGIKSHLWITNNLGGTDHSDPYAYLKSWGISKEQFKKDIANGVDYQRPNPTPQEPEINPDGSAEKIVKGSTVKVINAIDLNGTKLYVSGTYKVMELSGNRAVIGKNNVVTAAIDVKNLKLANAGNSNSNNSNGGNTQVTAGWSTESASFTPNFAINVRYGASTTNSISGTLPCGDTIHYNAWKSDGRYVWIRYESYNGTRYMVVRENGQAWGTFQ